MTKNDPSDPVAAGRRTAPLQSECFDADAIRPPNLTRVVLSSIRVCSRMAFIFGGVGSGGVITVHPIPWRFKNCLDAFDRTPRSSWQEPNQLYGVQEPNQLYGVSKLSSIDSLRRRVSTERGWGRTEFGRAAFA